MKKDTTQSSNYILGPINLGKQLTLKNRELTKVFAAANERIKTIPNPIIMFNQIILLESKGSSSIENIITTNDELYKEVISESPRISNASKTLRIKSGIKYISKMIEKQQVILQSNIKELGIIINGNNANYRPNPGTKIINQSTGKVIHTPPQNKEEVLEHMKVLLEYINNKGQNDPLTDSLLVHHAFEWIHPFIDGNGRIGRILMAAYLKLSNETDHIFLPTSYFINKKRNLYYKALENMTNNQDYEFYLNVMFDFLIEASQFTIKFARKYDENRTLIKEVLSKEFNKYYEQKIIDSLFFNAYTTPSILVQHTGLNYRTIKKIIIFLTEKKYFEIKKENKNAYYINNLLTKGEYNE